MISYIKGKLTEKNPTHVIIECYGVGYYINISLNTYSKISDLEDCRLLTYLSIKEDSHTLYGFISESERNLFKNLISVSGVGPSTAMMTLSAMPPQEIIRAIIENNVDLIRTIKGIGPKTAQRLILELKDKLKKEGADYPVISTSGNTSKNEALLALETLGFSRNTTGRIIEQLINENNQATVSELIKLALKKL